MIEPVRKTITVKTSPERAFTVFTTGSWWPKEHSILASGSPQREVVIEPRVGGRWYEIGEDNSECVWGQVIAWDPPRRMVLGWEINGNFQIDRSATTEVEVNFIPEGEGTRVELEHRGFERYAETGQALRDAVGSDGGWGGLLKLLAAKVEASPATEATPPVPTRYFVCKLITPRPTFMQDMSDEEGAALGAHIGYWKGLVAQKQVLIFGPVGDPSGVWGLGVLKASDQAEAQKIAGADPAVTSATASSAKSTPCSKPSCRRRDGSR